MRAQLYEPNTGPNIQKEKEIVKEMIELYCRKNHHRDKLCKNCQDLKSYAVLRLSLCRYGEGKSACMYCHIHCFKTKYREEMRDVMSYSWPWMFLYHPFFSIKHVFNGQSS
ncbi:nitrous oxide-stimulated promoter family protein [Neobacillus dielmonensis]|uniref:nitrous oxide-stimulated promoter family protein n=1 Tax=Neobacillus dielmonensis TaxID=1347369 RepID=UPI0005A98B9E|nr:nitrous oxide-stimulated promoter family protein [Neobacillus dielmonensis]